MRQSKHMVLKPRFKTGTCFRAKLLTARGAKPWLNTGSTTLTHWWCSPGDEYLVLIFRSAQALPRHRHSLVTSRVCNVWQGRVKHFACPIHVRQPSVSVGLRRRELRFQTSTVGDLVPMVCSGVASSALVFPHPQRDPSCPQSRLWWQRSLESSCGLAFARAHG